MTRNPIPVFLLTCLAAPLLYARPLLFPVLMYDDFQIVAQSWTWEQTRTGLWKPQNEHAMPLGRLLTFALMRVGGRATVLPWTAAAVGPFALLIALPLVYHFVRRECGHPLHGHPLPNAPLSGRSRTRPSSRSGVRVVE